LDTLKSLLGRSGLALLALWVGGTWCLGYMVAPTLFSLLEDRALAGSIAGRLFELQALLGLVCCAVPLAMRPGRWVRWLLLLLLASLLIQILLLQPMMTDLGSSARSADPAFVRLHGVAVLLYLLQSLAGLGILLVWCPGGPGPHGDV
jgi:hypothetical protein